MLTSGGLCTGPPGEYTSTLAGNGVLAVSSGSSGPARLPVLLGQEGRRA